MRTILNSYFEVVVEDCNLNYEGSLSLPEKYFKYRDNGKRFMDEPQILDNEIVHIFNRSNGAQFETYAIKGDCVCLNGAAARLGKVGDLLEITTWRLV